MTQSINAQDAYNMLKGGQAILIDVRENIEFTSEHIPYAISLPLSNINYSLEKLEVSKDTKIIFQCLKGARGSSACACAGKTDLAANEIYNLEGGINEWKSQGLPLIKTGAGISVIRQVQLIVGTLIFLGVLAGYNGFEYGFVLAGIFGGALAFAGLSGWCGLAMILKKMPWNR